MSKETIPNRVAVDIQNLLIKNRTKESRRIARNHQSVDNFPSQNNTIQDSTTTATNIDSNIKQFDFDNYIKNKSREQTIDLGYTGISRRYERNKMHALKSLVSQNRDFSVIKLSPERKRNIKQILTNIKNNNSTNF